MFNTDKQLYVSIAALVIPLVGLAGFSVATNSAEMTIEPQVNEAKYDLRDKSYRGRWGRK